MTEFILGFILGTANVAALILFIPLAAEMGKRAAERQHRKGNNE